MAEETLQIKKKHIIIAVISLIVIITAAVFVFNSGNNSSSGSVIEANRGELRLAELSLPGMFCAGCAWSSENALEGMQGVVSADVDIETKTGTVVYDPNLITKEQLVEDGLIQAYDGKVVKDEEYRS